MKLVAVSQRVEVWPDRGEIRDALDQRLLTFLRVCEYLPVPVPNGLHSDLDNWLEIVTPAAVLLSGGNNIGECSQRDSTERTLLDYSRENLIPVLGICRGMQMISQWAGSGLREVAGHVRTRHKLTGEISAEVNSYHSFAISTCPEGFDVLARSDDGEIEAIRHRSLPWEGWMWHPEREEIFASGDLRRLRTLFGA